MNTLLDAKNLHPYRGLIRALLLLSILFATRNALPAGGAKVLPPEREASEWARDDERQKRDANIKCTLMERFRLEV